MPLRARASPRFLTVFHPERAGPMRRVAHTQERLLVTPYSSRGLRGVLRRAAGICTRVLTTAATPAINMPTSSAVSMISSMAHLPNGHNPSHYHELEPVLRLRARTQPAPAGSTTPRREQRHQQTRRIASGPARASARTGPHALTARGAGGSNPARCPCS